MKLVKENLSFERGGDPKKKIGIGGKLDQIKKWLSQFIFTSQYVVNRDYAIDTRGDIIFTRDIKIEYIPEYIKFNICNGDFLLGGNSLLDLKGCPRIVKGDFYVPGNKISSLDGSPEVVEGDYLIGGNLKKFTEEEIRKVTEVAGRVLS